MHRGALRPILPLESISQRWLKISVNFFCLSSLRELLMSCRYIAQAKGTVKVKRRQGILRGVAQAFLEPQFDRQCTLRLDSASAS